jgi:type VI secretion system secreted protein Hcp
MPIYMQYEGIKGSVTEKGHVDWIELESCQVGANRHIETATGKGKNRSAGAPSLSEIVGSKTLCKASVNLFKASLSGEGKKVVIDFCRTEGDKVEKYLTITLENALISSYSISGHGGSGTPMESLSLNYTKIEYAMVNRDAKDKSGGADRANFDLAAGVAG